MEDAVRSFVKVQAGRQIRGEGVPEGDWQHLLEYIQSFPELRNPMHVRCEVPGHRSRGFVIFPDEKVEDVSSGSVREQNGIWICSSCGNDTALEKETLDVIHR